MTDAIDFRDPGSLLMAAVSERGRWERRRLVDHAGQAARQLAERLEREPGSVTPQELAVVWRTLGFLILGMNQAEDAQGSAAQAAAYSNAPDGRIR